MHNSPVTLFELFIANEIVNLNCKETNSYAAQKGNHSLKFDPKKFKSFITVSPLSDYIPYPRRFMYLEMRDDSRNSFVTSLFTRNRFLDVLQYIDLADNNNLDANDKFAKLQPFFKILNKNCLKNFIPERNAGIEESVVPYYGRHGCKQYMQSKLMKFGYKLWVAATPLWYAIQFYPYAGKDANYDKELDFGGSFVMSLVPKFISIPKSSNKVVMDNLFTSLSLLQLLKSKSIAATDKVRSNRTENSPLISVEEMKKKLTGICNVVNDRKSIFTLVRWKNKKNCHSSIKSVRKKPNKEIKLLHQRKRWKSRNNQPSEIAIYKKAIGGVNRMDEDISVYMINIRNKKCW